MRPSHSLLSRIHAAALMLWTALDAAADTTTVRLKLGWLPDAHHAGFYAAQVQGYYADAGLSVEIIPGGSGAREVDAVASGDAEFGQAGGLGQVLTAIDRGTLIKPVAVLHRDTPHALISLASNPVTTLSQLLDKTVAVAYGDAAELLLNAAIERAGLDKSRIHFVPFDFNVEPLLQQKVHVVTGFWTDQPAVLKHRGSNPTVMKYSDMGVQSYGYTLFASEEFLRRDAAAARRFLEATRRGYDRAFLHPGETIEAMATLMPTGFEPAVEREKLNLVREIMCGDSGALNPWNLEPERVNEVARQLRDAGLLQSSRDFAETVWQP